MPKKNTPQPPERSVDDQGDETQELNSSDLVVDRPDDVPRFYSNHVISSISPWDIEILFGDLHKTYDNQKAFFSAKALVSVMLSPQHAKAVAKLLTAQIARYEKVYGAIPDVAHVRGPGD